MTLRLLFFAFLLFRLSLGLRADDGYNLWLNYNVLPASPSTQVWKAASTRVVVEVPTSELKSPSLVELHRELEAAVAGLLQQKITIDVTARDEGTAGLGAEGFSLRLEKGVPHLRAHTAIGALYGAFDLIRRIQTLDTPPAAEFVSKPRIQVRMLNHWDDLNRHVERGYAGFSLWEWFYLPEITTPRYRDYARACASLGINGTVLTNVNANALVLTPAYLEKVKVLADIFRPFGVRVYLTARFSAPIEIGGLKTADPLDPSVRAWWKAKTDEVYRVIPDFGGFLVKANSEGQPGPQDYGRNHADGANMLAEAIAPHGGLILWRAFVYSHDNSEDRVRQAVTEFEPLDGKFLPNVVIQIKNGPLDFMPREPFSPLFGHLPKTHMALELQITQEYLGQSTQLAYLAPMWKEVLDADTFVHGPDTPLSELIDGSHQPGVTVIAGVANTGTDRNWTGHLLAQSNWYAYGRLAWDHSLSSEAIAREWTRLTFGHHPTVEKTLVPMLEGSRETVVRYSMPLGLHHIMAEGHHYGPGPWVDNLGRADWNSTYYHRADAGGIGFDRTASGSNAIEQYAPQLQALWGGRDTCPENLLLWFHRVGWDEKLKSGRTLWDELCLQYQEGVEEVRVMQAEWNKLQGLIDAERFEHVRERLVRQEKDAVIWRDACLLYFQTFSKRPFPPGVEKAAYPLEHYTSQLFRNMPGHH